MCPMEINDNRVSPTYRSLEKAYCNELAVFIAVR